MFNYELFINELEYLKENTDLSPIISAKIAYLRKNARNQREVDKLEYKYRFKNWQKKHEKDWKSNKEKLSLEEFAHNLLETCIKDNNLKM